jgi:hypothetical protein
MWGVFIFMREAGMSQRRASKSNSAQRAPISSDVRTKVSAINFMARRVTAAPCIAFDVSKQLGQLLWR